MSVEPSKAADLPTHVDAGASEIVARLEDRLLSIHSLWFPTRSSLAAWRIAGVPLYVRRLGPARIEIGPRLENMWASCFSPVWWVDLGPGPGAPSAPPGATPLRWRRRLPTVTVALLVGWWGILVAWPLLLWLAPGGGEDPGRQALFWAVLVLSSTGGPAVGWVLGGAALDEALPWLRGALLQPSSGEDW
ncbi:MAG TPA: hypothetical protein ENK18_27175 [Deltaproteobacteria bacterium]|nr:hypothetical protein [Deltaproteobacteria bacterium]